MIHEILCFFSWRPWRLGGSIILTTHIGLLYIGLTHFNVIPSLRATAKQSPQGRDCFTPLRCVRNDILPCCVSPDFLSPTPLHPYPLTPLFIAKGVARQM